MTTTEDTRRNANKVAKKTQTYLDVLRERMNSTSTTTASSTTTTAESTTDVTEETVKSEHPTAQ